MLADNEDYKDIHAIEHDISTIAGNSVRLTCQTQGHDIQWTRENGPLPSNYRTVDDYLELVHVRPEDSGRYICQIRNMQGISSDYINLHVAGRLNFITQCLLI